MAMVRVQVLTLLFVKDETLAKLLNLLETQS